MLRSSLASVTDRARRCRCVHVLAHVGSHVRPHLNLDAGRDGNKFILELHSVHARHRVYLGDVHACTAWHLPTAFVCVCALASACARSCTRHAGVCGGGVCVLRAARVPLCWVHARAQTRVVGWLSGCSAPKCSKKRCVFARSMMPSMPAQNLCAAPMSHLHGHAWHQTSNATFSCRSVAARRKRPCQHTFAGTLACSVVQHRMLATEGSCLASSDEARMREPAL